FGKFDAWGDTRWSPGMERAKARRSGGNTGSPTVIEGEAQLIQSVPRNDSRYRPGTRVFHQKFGYGTISLVEGERLTIAFDMSGEKKVVASFVKPAAEAG